MRDDLEWHTAAKDYLDRLCHDEWTAQGRPIPKGKYPCRYAPSDYVRDLIDCLNKNDEDGFKALKMLKGYASAAGV